MRNIKRKWDVLTKERRDTLTREIITYFKTERDLEIGVIAAEDILDFFLQALVADIYNKAVSDSKKPSKKTWTILKLIWTCCSTNSPAVIHNQ